MATGLHPFPSELNQVAVGVLIEAVGGKVDIETGHAAWDVAGFAYSQFDKHPTPMGSGQPVALGAEAKAFLESIHSPENGPVKAIDWSKVDWQQLFNIALTIWQMFMNRPKTA